MGNTAGVPWSHDEFQFSGARQTLLRSRKGGRSLLCKGGAAFPHFVAVQALTVAAVGGGFVELLARDLVERALHAAHRDRRVRRDDARKLLDVGIDELRRHRLVEIADAQRTADSLSSAVTKCRSLGAFRSWQADAAMSAAVGRADFEQSLSEVCF